MTIADIARAAGVSKGAVSYALNGRPGVSDATRQRVLALARELDWAPNSAARMLSGSRTETFGLVLARDPTTLGAEPFHMQFIAGLESVLGLRGYALLLQVVGSVDVEMATHRRWAAQGRVDAVVVVDLREDDPRVPLLLELQVPAVVAADPSLAGGLPSVWNDDASAADAVVHHLAGLGHARLARVAGPAGLGYVGIRDRASAAAAEEAGAGLVVVHTDFTGADGARATRQVLRSAHPPTAVVYDNDLMAVAGLSAATSLGLDVPRDVSLVAWDDSALCRVTHPPLTAMGHDVLAYGAAVAEALLAAVAGERPASRLVSTPRLRERASTSAPPALP